jgi:hypothetical protein
MSEKAFDKITGALGRLDRADVALGETRGLR